MDWSKGFSSSYYVTAVDRETWRDIEGFRITGGSIKREAGSLMQSADIGCGDHSIDSETLIRVWLEASQNGASSRTALFTGYATSPGRDINGSEISHTLECYSILKPASDVLLPRGWYAPVGMNVIMQARELLKVTKAPITVDGEYEPYLLNQAVIAEQNETNLTMAELLLESVGWRIVIDGRGQITLCPKPAESEIVFDALTNDIVEPKIKDEYDWYGCPNCIRVVKDETSAEWKDEYPESIYSVPRRGREVWIEETNVTLNDNETLAEYARRRLSELQLVGRKVSYDRAFRPDLLPGDIIRLNYPAQGLVGAFEIQSQNITLGSGARMSEEVVQI